MKVMFGVIVELITAWDKLNNISNEIKYEELYFKNIFLSKQKHF